MKKQLLIIAIILLLMIVGFGGCTDINNDEINNTNGEINNIFLNQ